MQSLFYSYWEFRQSVDHAWLMIKTARTGKSAIARAVCTSNNYFCKQIFGMFLNCMLKSSTLPRTRHWKTMKGIILGWKEKIWWPNMYIMHTVCGAFFHLVFKSEAQCEEGNTALFSQPQDEDVEYIQSWKPSWEWRTSNCSQTPPCPLGWALFLANGLASLRVFPICKQRCHPSSSPCMVHSLSSKPQVLFMTGMEWCHLLLALLSETAESFF